MDAVTQDSSETRKSQPLSQTTFFVRLMTLRGYGNDMTIHLQAGV